jgi:hypothetical protein
MLTRLILLPILLPTMMAAWNGPQLLIRLAQEAGADAAKFQNFQSAEDCFRLWFHPYECPGFSPGKVEKIGV